ncbi:MAG: hypothetical protein JSV81_20030 [Anaerolineales bacterium]|nr:MAG: hypothetical protein JSV81_20030 [Anaerolineales bacterium]
MQKRNDIPKSQSKKPTVLLIALLLATFSACSPKSTPPGPDTTAGAIEQAGYAFYRWEEGLALMIWHDAIAAYMSSGSGSTASPVYELKSYAETQDGRRVDWELQTSDGKTAQFMIDNTGYDLSKGTLFIITTKNDQTEVRQLFRNLSDVQPNRESCLAFARSDPDLASFINDTTTQP